MSLTILFEDNHCLAVAKPAPLLTQAPPGVPSLEAMVKDYIKATRNKPGNVYLGIPHRLDRAVTGVVLFARNSKAAARLAEQFEKRQVKKVYWALVEGEVPPAQGVWRDWLLKLPDEARAAVVAAGTPGAKEAVLRYRRLGQQEQTAFLEIELETGRMHQIRLQAASRGWPVVGDALYGSTRRFAPAAGDAQDGMIALHARGLTFLHPIRYEPVMVEAPVPAEWPQTSLLPSLVFRLRGGSMVP